MNGRARVATKPKPIATSRRHGFDHGRLVVVADRDEDAALRAAVDAAAELRFGESAAEIRIEPHHLAGRLHFRPEDQIDAGEAGEGKDRLLDRDMRAPPSGARSRKSADFSPTITRAAILAIGTPVALATNGTVREARGLTSRT